MEAAMMAAAGVGADRQVATKAVAAKAWVAVVTVPVAVETELEVAARARAAVVTATVVAATAVMEARAGLMADLYSPGREVATRVVAVMARVGMVVA
eukprot:2069427-Prymnesium_polylepis.1